MEAYDEAQILKALSDGDQAAFTLVMERYRHRVFRVALRVLGSRNQAAEIVQEVFIAVWDYRKKFAQSSDIGGYCYTVARNKSIKEWRKRSDRRTIEREYSLSQPNHAPAVEADIISQHYDAALHKYIDQLPVQQKTVLQLFSAGHSYEEIGVRLNITSHTVKYHLKSARKFIEQAIQPHLPAIIVAGYLAWMS
jgi:RNA polymerase sigma factor (sigma-70 family)